MNQKTAVIFGGTGFVGRYIVNALAEAGWHIRVATRVPELAYSLKTTAHVGQVTAVHCHYNDYDSIASVLKGATIAVNCIGILYERKKGDFTRIHADLPESIAAACAVEGVERLIHLSALGIDQATSQYAKSKREGEARLLKTFPKATILRPSVIFGPEDDFFNKFAQLAGILPILPLIGGGHTQFQPVYVGDVADAAMAAITGSRTGKDNPQGKIYALGGPETLTFSAIYDRLFRHTGRKRCKVPLPFFAAKVQATFLSLLPTPLLTRDQVESLKTDSIVTDKALTLETLGITPTALDMILPNYLVNYRAGGRFAA